MYSVLSLWMATISSKQYMMQRLGVHLKGNDGGGVERWLGWGE
jgi:hypothetical protein